MAIERHPALNRERREERGERREERGERREERVRGEGGRPGT
jgi:hypothetical protein